MLDLSDTIKKHFYKPQHVGCLDTSKPNVSWAEVKTPDGYTHMQLFLQMDEERIIDAKFKVLGCPCCIACLSLITQKIIGKPKSILKKITGEMLIKELRLPKERYSTALLAEDLLLELFEQN